MYNPNDTKSIINRQNQAQTTDGSVSMGARARSKERNRLKILASATKLFRERGFEAATLRDIASDAGLSTGAVFASFTDKTEIFLTVIEGENARVVTAMREALDDNLDLLTRLQNQLMRGYEAAQNNARIILSAFVMRWSTGQTPVREVTRLSDQIRHVLLDTLTAAQARNELPAGAQLEYAAEILEDLCFANMRRAFQASDTGGSFDLERMSKGLNIQISLIVKALTAA